MAGVMTVASHSQFHWTLVDVESICVVMSHDLDESFLLLLHFSLQTQVDEK